VATATRAPLGDRLERGPARPVGDLGR
jgi:hypothetical protein